MRIPLLATAASLIAIAFCATSAHGQATRTWVSGVGDDVNPCSRTAPCKTFAGAISKTAAGGIIFCLDPGGYGAVTITKSMTIDCSEVPSGSLASGTNGVVINAAASDKVTLRNLSIEGAGVSPGLRGVWILSAATVLIDKCRISGFRTAPGAGILVGTAGTALELHVKDTILSDNGNAAVGGGIVFLPTGANSIKGSLSRVELRDNAFGMLYAGTGTGSVRVMATDVVIMGNSADGVRIQAPSGGPLVSFFFDRATISGNSGSGALADGGNAHVVLGRSVIAYNNIGLTPQNAGTIWSYGNNHNNANLASDGGPSAAVVAE